MDFIRNVLSPALYHGHNRKPPFFEGWYFKLVSADERHRFAIIPGIIKSGEAHAFVQVLNGVTARADYHRLSVNDFHAARDTFDLRVGTSRFSLQGLALDVETNAGNARGSVRFGPLHPWPVSVISPGIMGWYAWVPGMECYHGVLGFDHALEGALEINGQLVDFSGGRGYIEKDWGAAFPEAYIWFQTNHFEQPRVSLTASVAIIPWMGASFPGFIIGLWRNGTLHHFATYTGAQTEHLRITDDHVYWMVSDRVHRLEMTAERAEAGFLKGPTRLDMGKRVDETLKASVQVKLTTRAGKVLFEDTGRHAGLEVLNHPALLRLATA